MIDAVICHISRVLVLNNELKINISREMYLFILFFRSIFKRGKR